MEALGRLFDVGTAWAPVDLDTADGATGLRVNMQMHDAVTFLIVAAAGATTAATLTFRQHTAYTGGTSNDLASSVVTDSYGVTRWYVKSEAVLDNDEAWSVQTQSELATITLAGATYGDKQYIIAVDIRADQLGAGYTHASVNFAATLGAPKLSTCLVLPHEMRYRRRPDRLLNLLNPGAVNA